jgi:hypothetical protein
MTQVKNNIQSHHIVFFLVRNSIVINFKTNYIKLQNTGTVSAYEIMLI